MNNGNHKATLEEISRRKMEVLEKIRHQNKVLSKTMQDIISPFTPSHHQGKTSLMAKFNTGINIFEGVITGIKLYNRLRKALRK